MSHHVCAVDVWQESDSANLESNIRWADAFILMYSVTDKCSFDECNRLKFLINYNKRRKKIGSNGKVSMSSVIFFLLFCCFLFFRQKIIFFLFVTYCWCSDGIHMIGRISWHSFFSLNLFLFFLVVDFEGQQLWCACNVSRK